MSHRAEEQPELWWQRSLDRGRADGAIDSSPDNQQKPVADCIDTLPGCIREIPGSANWGDGGAHTQPQEPGCPQALRFPCAPRYHSPSSSHSPAVASVRPGQRQAMRQHIHGGVLVAVADEPIARAEVRPHAERRPNARSASTMAVDNGSGTDAPTEYGRKIRWWSSARAIHPLLESSGSIG
jgi:hypothetical protein